MYPQLGAKGSPYARSVIPTHTQDINLPDPGLIFDSKIIIFHEALSQKFATDIL